MILDTLLCSPYPLDMIDMIDVIDRYVHVHIDIPYHKTEHLFWRP